MGKSVVIPGMEPNWSITGLRLGNSLQGTTGMRAGACESPSCEESRKKLDDNNPKGRFTGI